MPQAIRSTKKQVSEVASPSGLFRRKFPRKTFRKGVGFLIDGAYTMGRGIEIGEGGLSLVMDSEEQTAKDVVLSFQIPGGGFVSVRAEIKTCRADKTGGFVLGCSFKNLAFERKREIRFFVSSASLQ